MDPSISLTYLSASPVDVASAVGLLATLALAVGAALSKIEWTDVTWNPVSGCSRVSRGCDHCYAVDQTRRQAAFGRAKYQGLVNPNKAHLGRLSAIVDGDYTGGQSEGDSALDPARAPAGHEVLHLLR